MAALARRHTSHCETSRHQSMELFGEALPHASDSMEQFAQQGSPVTERVSFQSDCGVNALALPLFGWAA